MLLSEPSLAQLTTQQLQQQLKALAKLLKLPEQQAAVLCVKLPKLLLVPPGDMQSAAKGAAKLLKVGHLCSDQQCGALGNGARLHKAILL
jgi:hypothetical protein